MQLLVRELARVLVRELALARVLVLVRELALARVLVLVQVQ